MPGAVLGAGDSVMKKMDQAPVFLELVSRDGNQRMNKGANGHEVARGNRAIKNDQVVWGQER